MLVEMPVHVAAELLGPLPGAARNDVVAATERDLDAMRAISPAIADSAVAAAAVTMAYELQNPYNSATSKSMCAARLGEAMDRLRALLPADDAGGDALDDLVARPDLRIVGGPGTKG